LESPSPVLLQRPPVVENQVKHCPIGSDAIFMAMSMEHSENEGGKFTIHGYSLSDEDALIQTSERLNEWVKPAENEPELLDIKTGDNMICSQNIFPSLQQNDDCLRCKVMSNNENGTFCVKLVDYGFTKVVDKLWPDSTEHVGQDWIVNGLSIEYKEKLTKDEYDALKAKIATGHNNEENTMPIKFTEKLDEGFYRFEFIDKFWGEDIYAESGSGVVALTPAPEKESNDSSIPSTSISADSTTSVGDVTARLAALGQVVALGTVPERDLRLVNAQLAALLEYLKY